MPVVLQPIVSTPTQVDSTSLLFTDDGQPVVRPALPSHEACAIHTKNRQIITPKGACPTLEWTFLDALGNPIDLTTIITVEDTSESSETSISVSGDSSPTYTVKGRFSDCDIVGKSTVYEVNGAFEDLSAGKVRIQLPAPFVNWGGIYRVEIVLCRDDVPILHNRVLWNVEETLWGDLTKRSGIPSLGEIRMHLRDTAVENDLLQDVEYDDEEILHAIVRPVRYWNEIPPPVKVFSCRSFPYRYHWLEAIVGQLMQTAAHHYMRNEIPVNHGGVQGNFKDKYGQYLAYAKKYDEAWRVFVDHKKVEINAGMGSHSLRSTYDNII